MPDQPTPGSREWLKAKIAEFKKQQDQVKEQFATLAGAIQAYELLLGELPLEVVAEETADEAAA